MCGYSLCDNGDDYVIESNKKGVDCGEVRYSIGSFHDMAGRVRVGALMSDGFRDRGLRFDAHREPHEYCKRRLVSDYDQLIS